ncbi:MAG: F0F1 ATP synthase subunit B [Armatimonadota bacterium]
MEMLHQLGIDPKVLAAAITGFIFLWLFLARFLFKPVMGLIRARENDIKTSYADADAVKAEAQSLKTELDNRIAGIEAEARARIQSSIKEAQDAKDEIMADAKNRSEDILRRGQEDLVREREKTLAQIKEEVVNLSIGAAEKLIGDSLNDDKHRSLVNDFIDRIGTVK